jgi:ferredoxin
MSARYPVNPDIPHNALVKYNPITLIFISIPQIDNIPSMIILILVLVGFWFTGRGFCGWLCPVGTGLDIYNRLIGHKLRKNNRLFKPEYIRWKYWIFISCVVLLFLDVSLYWLFDPISTFTRNTALVVDPVVDTAVRETTRALSSVPGIGYGLEKSMRSIFNPLPVVSLYIWLFAVLLASIFILELIAVRFFCNAICPLGAFLGYVARFSPLRIVIDKSSCTSCGLCSKVCKTGALEFDGNIQLGIRECILCLSCIESCNSNSMFVRLSSPIVRISKLEYKRDRRDFINGIVGAIVLFPIFRSSDYFTKRPVNLIRPPGALSENQFTQVCVKCGSCMKVCYTSGIQPLLFENGINSLFTPRMDFNHGFCGYECNDCGNVCPTGAIVPLTMGQKRKTVMGIAKINRDICLPWAEKKPCLTCEEVCPIPKKAIELENRKYISDNGEEKIIKLPHVVEENCIGCGICVYHCPTEPEKAILIEYDGETRGGDIRESEPRERRIDFKTDIQTKW